MEHPARPSTVEMTIQQRVRHAADGGTGLGGVCAGHVEKRDHRLGARRGAEGPDELGDALGPDLLRDVRKSGLEHRDATCAPTIPRPTVLDLPSIQRASQEVAERRFVLDGEVTFHIGDQERRVGAGAFVPTPDGEIHAVQAVGERPARLLILNTPGHMHQAFFTGIGRPLPDTQTELPEPSEPDLTRVLAAAEASDMTILPPSGA